MQGGFRAVVGDELVNGKEIEGGRNGSVSVKGNQG